MEEKYSRRNQQPQSKSLIRFVILLLFINTFAIGFLLFLNVQATSKQEAQLNSIEKKVRLLEQGANAKAPAVYNTEQNVSIKDSSTKRVQKTQPSSVTESSTRSEQTTSSSETTEQSTERQAETVTTPPTATTYTVQSGDTLSMIAEKNKLSLQELMTKNNLTDSTVYIGQVLSLQ